MTDSSLLATLRDYVGFGEGSARILQEIGPLLRPHFSRIVTEFYDAVMRDPGARAVLRDDAQVERLRITLRAWLEELITGPYDDAYFEKRARIGRIHVEVGLEQRYMFSAMNLIRSGLHRALIKSSENSLGPVEGHEAIDQICDIELAIMLETYRDDYVLRKTAESELLAVMGKLTAGLAHEIRNPLNAAKLQLAVLQRNAGKVDDCSAREKIERRTSIVQDELRRLSMLLDDFLNLARTRSFEPRPCECHGLLREVIDLRRPELESRGIEIVAELATESPTQMAERDRLKQVVNNLITNATEAVVEGESPRIRVTSRLLDGGRWEVAVVDNGPGVDPDIAGRAFESFVTTKEGGTGLGLPIVKRIVELHGGEVFLKPAPGGGTRASFWIPVESE